MKCRIKYRDRASGEILEAPFNYALTGENIENVRYKISGKHTTMTVRTKAWMGRTFDILVVCTASPVELSPTAICTPTHVAVDRPMTRADRAMTVYTAEPELSDDERNLLLDEYRKGINRT